MGGGDPFDPNPLGRSRVKNSKTLPETFGCKPWGGGGGWDLNITRY